MLVIPTPTDPERHLNLDSMWNPPISELQDFRTVQFISPAGFSFLDRRFQRIVLSPNQHIWITNPIESTCSEHGDNGYVRLFDQSTEARFVDTQLPIDAIEVIPTEPQIESPKIPSPAHMHILQWNRSGHFDWLGWAISTVDENNPYDVLPAWIIPKRLWSDMEHRSVLTIYQEIRDRFRPSDGSRFLQMVPISVQQVVMVRMCQSAWYGFVMPDQVVLTQIGNQDVSYPLAHLVSGRAEDLRSMMPFVVDSNLIGSLQAFQNRARDSYLHFYPGELINRDGWELCRITSSQSLDSRKISSTEFGSGLIWGYSMEYHVPQIHTIRDLLDYYARHLGTGEVLESYLLLSPRSSDFEYGTPWMWLARFEHEIWVFQNQDAISTRLFDRLVWELRRSQ